nr:syncytin-A-like [Syngnathus scovelli]
MTKYKPLFFSSDVVKGNFTCLRLPGTGEKLGALPPLWCGSVTNVTAPFLPIARSDVWFWCNSNKLYDRLPFDSSGICALVTLLLPVHLIPMSSYDLTSFAKSVVPGFWPRTKRSAEWRGAANPTYIDAIGVPRGVPDEYKLVNQIAAGFESALCWWCTINKNVGRINYVHYDVQRLGNWSEAGFKAVHSQLAATSLMAFQNRMALDMLLSKEGGVCAMFGEQCCTFIPNNTAAGGSLSQGLEGLRALNGKMKEHSGVNTEVWTDWLNVFGKYRTLVSSALVSIAVFSAILTLCGCCCIPCLRSLINRLITTAISPPAETFPLLQRDDLSIDAGSFSSDDPVDDSFVVNLSGLFLDPSFADYDSVSSRV